MPYTKAETFKRPFWTDSESFAEGGKLKFYRAGTTTPTQVYSDDSGTSLGTEVTLNARGEPDTEIFLDSEVRYKIRLFVIQDGVEVQKWEEDNIRPVERFVIGTDPTDIPTNADLPNSSSVGTEQNQLPKNSDLPSSSSMGSQAQHDDPAGNALLARLDRLEQAFGIDQSGPAGSAPLAAIGKGAIVESGTNSNGSYVRWENGEQVCWTTISVDLTTEGWTQPSYPASWVGDRPAGSWSLNGSVSSSSSFSALYNAFLATRGSDWRFRNNGTGVETADILLFAWGYWK